MDIDEIILLNHISDAADIRRGQKIFIPDPRHSARTRGVSVDIPRPVPARETGRAEGFAWPVRGNLVSTFHSRDAGFWDQGLRIEASPGSSVAAVRQGKVVFVDELTGYGPTVIIDHMDGFLSVYAGRVQPVVRLGDTLHQGDTVAVIPAVERGFLYFEIRRHGEAADPLFYLPRS